MGIGSADTCNQANTGINNNKPDEVVLCHNFKRDFTGESALCKTSFVELTLISALHFVSPLDEKLIEFSRGYDFCWNVFCVVSSLRF